jgi:hypothetical protein
LFCYMGYNFPIYEYVFLALETFSIKDHISSSTAPVRTSI